MTNLFSLEVESSNMNAILEGDEVIVDPNTAPRGNGKELGVFRVNNGENFISKFTRYGNRILFLAENGQIQIAKTVDVEVVGKVVGGSFEMGGNSPINSLAMVL